MKKIAEDQVSFLMIGLETREKNALKALAQSVDEQDTDGPVTARIISYSRAETKKRLLLKSA